MSGSPSPQGGRAQVTVLGSAGTHPGPGRACSSYMVSAGGVRLLLDCGNGSLANLQRRWDVSDIDALLLSHLHPDHFADIYGLYYALRFHPNGPQRLRVIAPSGAAAFIGRLLGDGSEPGFEDICCFEEAAAGDRVEVGPVTVDLHEARHPVETLASRITVDEGVIAFSADSHTSPEITACARAAQLFICDATWLERQRPLPDGIHMTGSEAGSVAAEAGVARLLVTHVLPTNDPAEVAAEASRTYPGEILIARDLQEIDL